ncbi:UPF0158 family protein [Bizionia arctica]|uniref:Uncharacterized protein n=1 Tax=Bizionia arctica TaxID=1495645 RepID=A0A917G9Q0_9FLAO|nr:UPF0158 family protein [Bizionia arctica]GGG32244.1 hypothetical protein GCM10010976_00060 [Bizionia arctica]
MEDSMSQIIKEIASNLDCGFDSYYNSKTDEIVTIPNFSNFSDEEEFLETFKVDLKKVTKNKDDYIKIGVLESFESFKIMELFVDQISEKQLKYQLEKVLHNQNPFQNFKYSIENSDYRKSWFEFKKNELEKIVKNRLDD